MTVSAALGLLVLAAPLGGLAAFAEAPEGTPAGGIAHVRDREVHLIQVDGSSARALWAQPAKGPRTHRQTLSAQAFPS